MTARIYPPVVDAPVYGGFPIESDGSLPATSPFIYATTTELTADQLNNLASTPVDLSESDPTKTPIVVGLLVQYVFGTIAYPIDSFNIIMSTATSGSLDVGETLTNNANQQLQGLGDNNAFTGSDLVGGIMQLVADFDGDAFGAILTSTIEPGSADYAPGDTFTGDNGVSGEVDTVDGGGTILTYHLDTGGSGYQVGDPVALTADAPSIGVNGALTVDSIDPILGDGTASITLWYFLV